jgi:hypothetical protein
VITVKDTVSPKSDGRSWGFGLVNRIRERSPMRLEGGVKLTGSGASHSIFVRRRGIEVRIPCRQ